MAFTEEIKKYCNMLGGDVNNVYEFMNKRPKQDKRFMISPEEADTYTPNDKLNELFSMGDVVGSELLKKAVEITRKNSI